MSSLFEQAIIDAAALRETAMKNAEATLIEKYNKEFQSTVEKLLEQEEVVPPEPPPEMSQDAASANGEDPTGPTVMDAPIEDPMDSVAPTVDPTSQVFKNVKSAFFDLDGDDNELITINFDGLTAKPGVDAVAGNGGLNTPDMSNAAPMMEGLDEEVEIDLDEAYDRNGGNERYHEAQELDEEEELEEELDEEVELELEEGETPESATPTIDPTSARDRADAARLEKQAAERKAAAGLKDAEAQRKASKQPSLEEEVELTEEELNELEEALRVDVSVQPEGYMGSHKRKERENRAIAYAEARDDKKREYREEYAKKVADLQETLKKSEKQNGELISAIKVMKEQIEKINVSNAKLLYTNKVLSNVSLNERQKNNIVENITKAETVLEAKTIYETLQSTVQSVSQKTPKSLSEALNRKTSPFLVRKEPASLNDMMADRMKALAGIKRLD